ncbi:hypothetical protein SBBP2_20056 [Burkholderiales bacterium]|nr:hypothetical protein SBBP2_20056 [Burkholderiales bacterium]
MPKFCDGFDSHGEGDSPLRPENVGYDGNGESARLLEHYRRPALLEQALANLGHFQFWGYLVRNAMKISHPL